MNLLGLQCGCVHWLIKLCYQDGRQPAQPAAFRDMSRCVRVNKVMCPLNGCNTVATGAAV